MDNIELEKIDAKLKNANNLLDQIIESAKAEDDILKDYWISLGKGERAIGESFTVFHLRALKKLLNE